MKSYSIRLDIPNRETKIDEEDISQLIYKGLASKYIEKNLLLICIEF